MTNLITLGISVEGKTEALFVKYVLSRYLRNYNIIVAQPLILGGNVKMERVCESLLLLADEYDYVTSLYDFYGFEGVLANEKCIDLIERIKSNKALINKKNIIPYVQQYEFETLLFSNINTICNVLYTPNRQAECLWLFNNEIKELVPEDLNNSIETAPSKRILKLVKRYKKDIYGYIIAQQIGIDGIRKKCTKFSAWVDTLINLKKE